MEKIEENKIINLLIKNPELLLTMSIDKLYVILDMLEESNDILNVKIDNLEKKLKNKL